MGLVGTPADRLKGEAGHIGAAGVAMKCSGATQVELKECSLKGTDSRCSALTLCSSLLLGWDADVLVGAAAARL